MKGNCGQSMCFFLECVIDRHLPPPPLNHETTLVTPMYLFTLVYFYCINPISPSFLPMLCYLHDFLLLVQELYKCILSVKRGCVPWDKKWQWPMREERGYVYRQDVRGDWQCSVSVVMVILKVGEVLVWCASSSCVLCLSSHLRGFYYNY